MSNREQLFENYEDALFAILMDDLARAEGERLLELNQQLQDDPSAAVSDDVRQRCVDVIYREFAKKRRAASIQHAKKVLRILPWAVIIAMALMAIAFAAFPSFRAGVLNIIQSDSPDHESWSIFDSSADMPEENINSLTFSVSVPDGYSIEEIDKGVLNEYVLYRKLSDPDSFFSVNVIHSDSATISFDNEDLKLEKEFNFRGYNAKITSKGDLTRLYWLNPELPCIVIMVGENIPTDQLESIFESIDIQ